MSTLKISNKYSKLYQNPNEKPTEWRKIGAFNKVDNIIKLSNKFSHERILEIGCGDGAILRELSSRNYGSQLFGLEISKSLVNTVCKSKISKLEDCKLFDGYNIPFSDDEFDLVILNHVIEHVEYPRKLIYEAMRVGKLFIFEVPLEDTIRLKKNYDFNLTGHINYYSIKTFRILIQTCNLEILNEIISNPSLRVYKFLGGVTNIIRFFFREILHKLFYRSSTKILTYNYTVMCKEIE